MSKPTVTDLEAAWAKAGAELTAAQAELVKAAAALAEAQNTLETARQRVALAMAAAIKAFNDLQNGKG